MRRHDVKQVKVLASDFMQQMAIYVQRVLLKDPATDKKLAVWAQ